MDEKRPTANGGGGGGGGGGGPTPAERHRSGLPLRPGRLLVAEDEHLVAADLTLKLAQMGYTVVGPVSDGQAAVELAALAGPDMALVDIRMPRRDGISAAAELFQDQYVPVIVISAYSEQSDVDRASLAGVFGYLVKPVQSEQLRATIDVAWRRFLHYVEQQAENESLKRRLEDRRVIEQAKWALVKRRGVGEPEALKAMRTRARDTRRTLIEVARSVLESEHLLDDR